MVNHCPQCNGTSWDTSGTRCLNCGYSGDPTIYDTPYPFEKGKVYCGECLKLGRIREIPCKMHNIKKERIREVG